MAGNGADIAWRNRISPKRYRCNVCRLVFIADTNHWGRIYRGCAFHYVTGCSECVEAEEALKDAARERCNKKR